MYEQITSIRSFILSKIKVAPEAGIILGTGLGGLADKIDTETVLEYKDIPGFPVSTVEGHKGRLIFGKLGGKQVVAMQGRFHHYEGYSTQKATIPIRVMKLLGVKYLFVSNAAGGVNPEFNIGDLMVITDHINLIPNPLIGPNMEEFGVRFPPMNNAYDKEMVLLADRIGEEKGIKLRYGCYVGTTGPSLETQAEYRYFHVIGGDAVGMSTTPEVIVAAHCGIHVFGMSVITNIGLGGGESSHGDIQVEGGKAELRMTEIFTEILRKL